MNFNPEIEYIIYVFSRNRPDLYKFVEPEFFETDLIKDLVRIDKRYYHKYLDVPTLDVLIEDYSLEKSGILSQKDIELSKKKIRSIFGVDIEKYEEKWLLNVTKGWIQIKSLDLSLFDAISYFKSRRVTLENVEETIERVKEIIISKNSISFDVDLGFDIFDASLYKGDSSLTYPTGYTFFDKTMNGGWKPNTLTCLIGPPKRGKTLWLCNLSVNAIKNGLNVAYISFEMSSVDIGYRVASNLFYIPIDNFYSRSIDDDVLKKKIIETRNIYKDSYGMDLGYMYIKEFPTGGASVTDIEMYIKNLKNQKNIDIHLLVVDYINIMRSYKSISIENTYLKIKNISEELRGLAKILGVPIVTASQTNRSSFDVSDLELSDVAESTGLLHTSDNVYGIIQTESLRNTNEIICKALCLRYSGFTNYKHKFSVDYRYMTINEIVPFNGLVEDILYNKNGNADSDSNNDGGYLDLSAPKSQKRKRTKAKRSDIPSDSNEDDQIPF